MYPNDRNYYPASVDDIDRDIEQLKMARQEMIQRGSQKPMDAKDEQLVSLAHEAGEMKAKYRSEKERADKLEKSVERKQVTIEELRSNEIQWAEWKKRAIAAEATIERSKKLKRKKR